MGQPWGPNQPSGPWTAAGPPSPPGPGVAGAEPPPPDPWTTPEPSRPTIPFALSGAVVQQALVAGAAAVGAGLALAYAAALVVTAVTSGSGSSELIGTTLPGVGHLGAWLFGLGVGAPLVIESGGSAASFGAASANVTVHIAIPLVLAVVIGTATAVTRRSQRRNPVTGWPAMLAAAGCAAVPPFFVGLLVAAASRFSYSSGGLDGSASASIGVAVARGGLLPALIVFVVSLVTRVVSGGDARPEAARRQTVTAAVRAVVDYLVVTAALMTVAVLVALVASGAPAGAAVGVSLLWLPVLGIVATEMATFAPLTASGSIGGGLTGGGLTGGVLPSGSGSVGGTTSFSLYGSAAPGWWALAVLVPIVGVVVAGVRYARRRPATAATAGAPWAAVGTSALTLLVALFLLNLYAGVSISAGGQASSAFGSGSGGLSAGIGVGGLGYLSALVVGALLPLTGWLIARGRGSAAGPQPSGFAPPPSTAPPVPTPPVPQPVTSAPAVVWAAASVPDERPTSSGAILPPAPAPARPSRRAIALIAAVTTVVTAAAAVAVVLVVRGGRTTVGEASAASTAATTEAPPDTGTRKEGTSPSPTIPSETEPAYPTTSPGGIDLSEVATDPMAARVASVLDLYFGSINAHDGAGAASVFDPSGTVDPTDPAQVADFTEQISTTHDDQVVLHSISFDGAEYLVDVSFRSQQAAEYGPDGQTCTNWHLTYRFTAAVKLIKAINATYGPC